MLTRSLERESTARVYGTQSISLSLDLFDTTLIRRSSNRELFRRLGERAAAEWKDWTLNAVEFARWRQVSEERANRAYGSCKFMLDAVYNQFSKGYTISPARKKRLMAMELELEAEHLLVVPAMRNRIEAEHAEGRAVLFLSDMYLPSDWLREVLTKHGLWKHGDILYVSGEARASKSKGDLFTFAENLLGSRLDQPLHLGDNPWSDVTQADASGWRSKLFADAVPTPREKLLAGHSPDFGAMPETLAAAARIARLNLQTSSSPELATHIATVTGVAAPILVAYMLWVLRKAQDLGLKRIYFMTRDGLVLHNVFLSIIEKIGEAEDMDVRILGASRQVCRLSSLDPDAAKLPSWTTYNPHQLTVTSCLYRVGLRPEQFQSELADLGFAPQSWERPLSRRQIKRLERLLHQKQVRAAIHEAALQTRDDYETYLLESGLYDGVPAAIVDIGWRGSTFDSLLRRLPEAARPGLHLFLFGFLANAYQGLNGDNIHAYYCDDWRGQSEPGGDHLVSMLEDFVAVEKGALVGVKPDASGRMSLAFREIAHSDLDRERFAINMAAPNALIDALSRQELEDWSVDRMTPVWKRMMDELWTNPSQKELNEMALHRQEVDQSGHVSVNLATPYTWSELLWWVAGLRSLDSGISSWAHGRRALTHGLRRKLLNLGDFIHAKWPGLAQRLRAQKEQIGGYLRRNSN
jgi:FMN phosphatase YigB (HAD superfamily)